MSNDIYYQNNVSDRNIGLQWGGVFAICAGVLIILITIFTGRKTRRRSAGNDSPPQELEYVKRFKKLSILFISKNLKTCSQTKTFKSAFSERTN